MTTVHRSKGTLLVSDFFLEFCNSIFKNHSITYTSYISCEQRGANYRSVNRLKEKTNRPIYPYATH